MNENRTFWELEEKKLEFSKIKSIIDEKVIELLGEDIEFEPEEGFFDD
ncbi:MAG: hypothetical protein HN597_13300 [Desulfobacula sp.]|nr:hypothetical protein [Desulfobacula sp.]